MPRSIDDIIPPSRRRHMQADQNAQMPSQAPQTPPVQETQASEFSAPPQSTSPLPPQMPASTMPPTLPPRVKIRIGRSFPYGTAIIAVLVIALSAGALYAFSGAKVQVTPETQNVSVNDTFTATAGTGGLPFTIVTVTKNASAYVPAESTETANDSAQGTIVVSNAQDTPQSLITNTRFQTPAGLIFRIHNAITIPAATASGPGTLSVTVYADRPGQTYNVGPTSFTVPGLQGSSSYTLVTAQSSTAMLGGFTGTRASVSQTTDTAKQTALQETLATTLQTALAAQIPNGDVLIPGSSMTSYQTEPDTATTSATVQVSEQGTVTAIVFPETALAQAIAYKVVGTYSGEPVTLDSVSKLTFSGATGTSSSTSSTNLSGASTITFNLAGNATVIWKVDTSKIAGAVAGKTRDSAQQILAGFPEVDSAVLILRPFWANTFPEDPSHINITVTNPTSTN